MQDRLSVATDRLYGAALPDFVGLRRELEREAREAGDQEQAAAIRQLPKPTLAAWALNQLSREHRREVDLLLDAGHRLRQTQAALSTKGRSEFEQARQRERDAIQKLTASARSLLQRETGQASPAVVTQVGETLRATAASTEAREQLARGTFVKPLRPPSGFQLDADDVPSTTTPRAPAHAAERQDRIRQARQALEQARAAHRAAVSEHRARERDVKAAEREEETLRASLEKAEEKTAEARNTAAETAKTLARAEKAMRAAKDAAG